MMWMNPEILADLLGNAVQSQVAQFGIAFSLAAWIHARQVKKEIAYHLEGIRAAIVELGRDLRRDMALQSERIGKLEERVDKIEFPQNH